MTPVTSPGPPPFRHRVYGLRVQSSASLPGLAPMDWSSCPFPADVTVRWGQAPPGEVGERQIRRRIFTSEEVNEKGLPNSVVERMGEEDPVLRLDYADGTRFWFRLGTWEVWAVWPDALSSEDAATYLLGPVLGYLLRLRGTQVLHASAVALDPVGSEAVGAVALVGPPGAGKSTLAAALALRGYPVLSEDVCALCEPAGGCRGAFGSRDVAPGTVEVLPGYPLVRLWPDAVEMLWGSPGALPRLTPGWDKRYLALGPEGAPFCDWPLPLRTLVLLAPRGRKNPGDPLLEPVAPAEALIHLVGNTYRNLLLDRGQRVSEFRFLHRLLSVIPVWRAFPQADSAQLDPLLDRILEVGDRG